MHVRCIKKKLLAVNCVVIVGIVAYSAKLFKQQGNKTAQI